MTSDAVYATVAQFDITQSVQGQPVPTRDQDATDVLMGQLRAASRLIDSECDVIPGGFAPHDETYRFRARGEFDRTRYGTFYDSYYRRDGSGADELDLIEGGRVHWLREVDDDGITVDYSDGDDLTWDFDDDWVEPSPLNAAAYGEPYSSLMIVGASAPRSEWPRGGLVTIAGSWGWAAIPDVIRELAIGITRDTRDAERGGSAAVVEIVGEGVQLTGETSRLWERMKREYSQRLPVTFA